MLNGGFAISNGLLDPGSLGYISACIMGAITVGINELEKGKIKRHEVMPKMPKIFQDAIENKINEVSKEISESSKKEAMIKNILQEYVIGKDTPVVIYFKVDNDKGFPEETPLFWNPAMEKMSGYKFEEISGLSQIEILELLYGHNQEEFDRVYKQLQELDEHGIGYRNVVFEMRSKNGELNKVAWQSEKINSGGRISFGSCQDAEIQRIIRMDHQFDCYNKKTLIEDFIALINKYANSSDLKDENKIVSVIYCDIDHFKDFNNNYGHRVGDVVLSEFIDFIKKEMRKKEDNLYRDGGDEFVILCNFVNKDNIIERINGIRDHFSRHTIIIEFIDGEMLVKRIKHGSYDAAKAYYNANSLENKTIKQRIIGHEENLNNNKRDNLLAGIKGRLVLPPITTSWGVTDLHYAGMNIAKHSDTRQVDFIKSVLEIADEAMYTGKENGKNAVFKLENPNQTINGNK